ncbi:hypothetical protein C9I50_26535 [Pseudomonas prosekii]|uniref:hypothetical protein n=1 Tax=Pseudomonas prosekii TaxID=1148509 RepID=UPI000D609D48|nr:hypothetical protein [Pseudomonas prosekii]PWE37582.1 hypothetical protein C9I50_26535 [Pseudomonas prosekii]
MPAVQFFDGNPKTLDVILALQNGHLVVITASGRLHSAEIRKQSEEMLEKAGVEGIVQFHDTLFAGNDDSEWMRVLYLTPQFELPNHEIDAIGGRALDAWSASKKKLPYTYRE